MQTTIAKYISVIAFLTWTNISFCDAIRLALPSDVFEDYVEFAKDNKIKDINTFIHPKSRRDVVEVALVVRAITELGLEKDIEFIEISNYSRILKEIEKGTCFISATTVWGNDIKDPTHFYKAPLFAKEGEFVAGFYAHKDTISKLPKKIDWSKLTAVSNSQWVSDWTVLKKINPEKLYDVRQWNQMFRLVHSKRVDFLIAPFQKEKNLALDFDGMKLYPIQNYKTALPGTRAIAITTQKLNGHHGLQKKLARIFTGYVKSGLVKKAYEDSGWWNKKAETWQLIGH